MSVEKSPLLLSGSILVAGAMIGAGLFFGMRGRPTETAAPVRRAPVESPTTIAPPRDLAEQKRPPEPPRAGASSELQRQVHVQVLASLEKHRERMVKECWNPSFQKDPKPPLVNLAFRFIFDPKGQVLISGVGDPQEASRFDVARCLRDAKLPIAVAPPGAQVTVHVEITLP